MIYADFAASARVCKSAKEALIRAIEICGNPSSQHAAGVSARLLVEEARARVAHLIGCDPGEVYFTSGGTEADNLGVIGGFEYAKNELRRDVIVTSAIEHAAVLESVRHLESRGAVVRLIPADERDSHGEPTGRVSVCGLSESVCGAGLVCLMYANNETGTVQPVREAVEIAHSAGAIAFCDAVQAVGHVKVDVRELGVDILSISGHKLGAPGGIGALYVKDGIKLPPRTYGGGQERGLRSGTLPVAQISAFGAACDEAEANLACETELSAMRDRIARELMTVREAHVNGEIGYALPGILNLSFDGVGGEELSNLCSLRGVCISTGSACHSGEGAASRALIAMGYDRERALGAVRISIGRGTDPSEADEIVRVIKESVDLIRG